MGKAVNMNRQPRCHKHVSSDEARAIGNLCEAWCYRVTDTIKARSHALGLESDTTFPSQHAVKSSDDALFECIVSAANLANKEFSEVPKAFMDV